MRVTYHNRWSSTSKVTLTNMNWINYSNSTTSILNMNDRKSCWTSDAECAATIMPLPAMP